MRRPSPDEIPHSPSVYHRQRVNLDLILVAPVDDIGFRFPGANIRTLYDTIYTLTLDTLVLSMTIALIWVEVAPQPAKYQIELAWLSRQ